MNSQGEIRALTGLRGWAALWVVLFHFQFAMYPVASFYFKAFDNRFVIKGSLAVDIFFALSGFVLAYAAQNWNGENPVHYTFNFLRARLARIYPMHVATMGVMCFFIDWRAPNLNPARAAIAHLGLLHAWGQFYSPDFNYPSWSLSAEWAAYLAFPFLLFASRWLSRRPALAVLSVLAAGSGLAVLGAMLAGGKCDFTWDYGWLRCLAEFWIGLHVYQAYRYADARLSQRTRNVWAIAALAGALAHVIFAGIDAWIIPMATLLVFATSLQPTVLTRLFANRVSYHIGKISFSVYMLHVPVGMMFLKWTMKWPELYSTLWGGLAMIGVALCLLLGVSHLTYHYFEMPMKRRLSRKPKITSSSTEKQKHSEAA